MRDPKALIFILLVAGISILQIGQLLQNQDSIAEDAAILMRYAEHLGAGHGIVWNIDEAPVDGATDFLYMLLLALFVKIGLSLKLASLMICLSSHFLMVAILGMSWYRAKVPPSLLCILLLFVLLGRGVYISNIYFGTSFFALWVTLSWALGLRIIQGETKLNWAFALSCLLMGLSRPEGVLLSGFMVIAIWLSSSRKVLVPTIKAYLWVFGILGSTYFAWHWLYFGYPLPNPYYVKGGATFYPDSLLVSILHSAAICFPFLLLYLIALYQKGLNIMPRLLPFVAGVLMWILLSDEMNFGGRFQYPLLGLVALGWEDFFPREILDGHATYFKKSAVLLAGLGLLLFQHNRLSEHLIQYPDGREKVGKLLAQYRNHDYRLASTEAGLLPLFSQWKSLDTWGLNDSYLAHHFPITKQYLREWNPDLLCFHDQLIAPSYSPKDGQRYRWSQMTDTIRAFLREEEYDLISAYGPHEDNIHFYYIKTNNPHKDSITSQIRNLDYRWYANGNVCQDFRQSLRNK